MNYRKLFPPIIWAGLIFYLSSIPSLKTPFGIWDLYLRKAAHITEYIVLVLLISPNFVTKNIKTRIISALIAVLYAISDEYHQSFVPGRSMEFTDMAWDWIGCSFGYFLLTIKKNGVRLDIQSTKNFRD